MRALWFLLSILVIGGETWAQKQGADLLKTDLLCVLAHPDDETGMASTLAYYAHGRDKVITPVYCTRGEGGGNMVGTHWGPSLGVLREVELKHCLSLLGIERCFFLEQVDWAYTESAAMTLEKWDREAALERLVRIVRATRPEVILTMNPFPQAGQHGHHQAAGILAVEAYSAAADPEQFPEQLTREGLTIWQSGKLYFRGDGPGDVAKINGSVRLADGRTPHEIAAEALSNHRSQGFGRFRRATFARPPEAFGLVKSVVEAAPVETDFFVNLPVSDGARPLPPPPRREKEGVTMAFAPRSAVIQFRKWAESYQIDHLVSEIPPDLSVIAGESNEVTLVLQNLSSEEATVNVSLPEIEGWSFQPKQIAHMLPPHGEDNVKISVAVPSDAREDQVMEIAGGARVNFHPVPQLEISKGRASNAPENSITETMIVQGKAESAADCSGTFQLGYDDEFLYVNVRVRDESVVSNIAPNDIRGHWRSDSVEICVDPSGKSEHTLSCFKVGIFPFDQTGAVRGARDADANQGPIEETAPGMKLASAREADGYRIEAAIPWKVMGVESLTDHPQIGFNLLLYDGDKAEAEPGENINECRLAWAPRRSVQGRPEDWGRLVLK